MILPVKDGARYLAEALESVAGQSVAVSEILVVDGGSKDTSREIAGRFDLVRVLRQNGTGLSGAWNQGIDAARGELIAFIESDDLWTERKIEGQLRLFELHPDALYCVGRVEFFLEAGHAIPHGFKPELFERDQLGWIPGTLMARRELFEELGGFRTDLRIAADVDWFARCRDRSVPAAVLDEVLLRKRIHDRNLSSNARANTRELLRLLKDSLDRRRALP